MILIPRLGHGKIVKNTDPYFEMYAVDWVMKKSVRDF